MWISILSSVLLYSLMTSPSTYNLTFQDKKNLVINSCETNVIKLDNINSQMSNEKLVIVVARLGSEEHNTEINLRRLHNFRLYLVEHWNRSPEKIILTQGERTQGVGQLEIYILGVLYEKILIPQGEDILVGSCDGTSNVDKLFFRSHKWKVKTRKPKA